MQFKFSTPANYQGLNSILNTFVSIPFNEKIYCIGKVVAVNDDELVLDFNENVVNSLKRDIQLLKCGNETTENEC